MSKERAVAENDASGTGIDTDSPTDAVDHLAKLKGINIERRDDRRATQSGSGDRRAYARHYANGELVADRREKNRLENALSLAEEARKKAA